MDLKPLITLVAIVNPLAIIPFFIHYTQGFSDAQRRDTIRTASFSAFCVISACALLGLQVLDFRGRETHGVTFARSAGGLLCPQRRRREPEHSRPRRRSPPRCHQVPSGGRPIKRRT